MSKVVINNKFISPSRGRFQFASIQPKYLGKRLRMGSENKLKKPLKIGSCVNLDSTGTSML